MGRIKAYSGSELPPSSSNKWMNCYGWLKLNRGLPPSESSPAAEEGTRAHALMESLLLEEINPTDLLDNEMSDYIMSCVQHVHEREEDLGPGTVSHCETVVDFGEQFGYMDLTGTSDVVLISDDHLGISDLKYGYGLVEAPENTQLMIYLSGAVQKFGARPSYSVEIMQPRPLHPDGPNRLVEVTPAELDEFNDRLEAAIEGNYAPNPKCNPGDWCMNYCRAAGFCRALAKHNLKVFEDNPLETISK